MAGTTLCTTLCDLNQIQGLTKGDARHVNTIDTASARPHSGSPSFRLNSSSVCDLVVLVRVAQEPAQVPQVQAPVTHVFQRSPLQPPAAPPQEGRLLYLVTEAAFQGHQLLLRLLDEDSVRCATCSFSAMWCALAARSPVELDNMVCLHFFASHDYNVCCYGKMAAFDSSCCVLYAFFKDYIIVLDICLTVFHLISDVLDHPCDEGAEVCHVTTHINSADFELYADWWASLLCSLARAPDKSVVHW